LKKSIKLKPKPEPLLDHYYESDKFLARTLLNVFTFAKEVTVDRLSQHTMNKPVEYEVKINFGRAAEYEFNEAKELGFTLIRVEKSLDNIQLKFRFDGKIMLEDKEPYQHSDWNHNPEIKTWINVKEMDGER